MAAMALFSEIWPGILGATATGIVIYLSLRGMARSRGHLAALKLPAGAGEATYREARAQSQRLEG